MFISFVYVGFISLWSILCYFIRTAVDVLVL